MKNYSHLRSRTTGQDQHEITDFDADLAAGDSILLSTTASVPGPPGAYNSSWQVADADGNAIGDAFDISLIIFVRATLTPTSPPESPTPEVTEEPDYAAAMAALRTTVLPNVLLVF